MKMKDLIRATAQDTGQTIAEVEATLWSAFDIIARSVAAGETLNITNFGTFDARQTAGRMARHIGTGEPMVVPPLRLARFKASGRMRVMVREGNSTDSIRKPIRRRPEPPKTD